MASPITTSGFTVQERPGINYLDPRMFASGLSEIVPNIGRGASTVGGLFEMQENAQLRPTRKSLADIQLQEAQNRLAMAPLEQQLAALRLGEAQQRAAIPSEIIESVDILGGGTRLSPTDPNATFENFTITEEYAPKVRRTGGTRVGAGGVLTPFTRDETLKSAAEIETEAALNAARIRSTDALASQRARPKEYEYERLAELYDNAVATGDTEAAGVYKARIDRLAAAPGTLASGTTYARRVEQQAADAGITLEAAMELVKTPGGADALVALANARKSEVRAAGAMGIPSTVTPEQQALIDAAARPRVVVDDEFELAVGGDPVRVNTKAERDALPPGTEYIGPDGKTYIKK